MIRDYLSTARQDARHELRRKDVQELLALGWKEWVTGNWKDPLKGKSYPTAEAINLEICRSRILRNGQNKGLCKHKRRK